MPSVAQSQIVISPQDIHLVVRPVTTLFVRWISLPRREIHWIHPRPCTLFSLALSKSVYHLTLPFSLITKIAAIFISTQFRAFPIPLRFHWLTLRWLKSSVSLHLHITPKILFSSRHSSPPPITIRIWTPSLRNSEIWGSKESTPHSWTPFACKLSYSLETLRFFQSFLFS